MYKVNLHLLEGCNFRCKTCFAHFNSKGVLTTAQWKQVIDNLHRSRIVDAINFAGGEPMLYAGLDELIQYAKDYGMKTSIITNGSLVTTTWLRKNVGNLDMIGFSIDSFDNSTSVKLGRCCQGCKVFGKDEFMRLYDVLAGADVKVKINTVVNKLNYEEEFSQHLQDVHIDRWKVLRMKPFSNGVFNNYALKISDEQFRYFVDRNPYENRIVEDSLVNSYFVVDSNGRLLDNSSDGFYGHIGNVLDESFERILQRYTLDTELYYSRYNGMAS